jgi:hypothetical protein
MREAVLAGGFFRHRGLIAFCAGGAIAEAGVLSFLAPAARPLAPQVTALPPLAAYHDLRWLFAFNQSWLGFTGVLVLLLVARSAVDAVLLLLAWPDHRDADRPAVPRPGFLASFLSCAVLTVLVWLVMSPVVTLMFGVALVPFSWPYLAAVPILLGTAIALSQGGVGQSWWRRLPPARTVAWLLATFIVLTAASLLMAHLNTAGIVAVAAAAGVVDARAWYGLTTAAVRRAADRPPQAWYWQWALWQVRRAWHQRTSWLPVAPIAAVLVIALVVGVARLSFTGTLRFTSGTAAAAAVATGLAGSGHQSTGSAQVGTSSAVTSGARGAVLVADGFGSNCCHDAASLQADLPGMVVRQFSYLGLSATGNPIPYARAGDLSIQVLGDRMATQVEKLHARTHAPVDIVAESEGTLGLYAMLAQHPHLPVGSLALLSPIVDPGQVSEAGLGVGTVPGAALLTLNDLVGGMSPYGSSGAQALIDSVGQVGASYFAQVSRDVGRPWLAVVPLADAVTLPSCAWPRSVVFVAAFHGGLLGSASVQRMVASFLSGGPAPAGGPQQRELRRAAQAISAAAAAWRMPELSRACPVSSS